MNQPKMNKLKTKMKTKMEIFCLHRDTTGGLPEVERQKGLIALTDYLLEKVNDVKYYFS